LYWIIFREKNSAPKRKLTIPIETEETTTPSHGYINMMADALKDYDDNAHAQDFYESLAWIGLKGTVAWEAKEQNEQDAINTVIQNELNEPPCQ